MIVTTAWLAEHLHDPDLVIADIRSVTNQPDAGRMMYRESHIPGAVFLDLDQDLADRSDLSKGRHPLPDPRVFVQNLARVGIGQGKRVVAYDDKAGSNAARLWWMLRWIGVRDGAVLDGGIIKWKVEGRPLESGEPQTFSRVEPFDANADRSMIFDKTQVEDAITSGFMLVDARSGERFRGEREPIDARAGHIPGARNAPWEQNITSDAVPIMKSADELRRIYQRLGIANASPVVCYCGSGVTACHDILALELAGFPGAKLYPGSWSEWIVDKAGENQSN